MESNEFAVFMVGSMIAGFFMVKSLKAEALRESLQWLAIGVLVNTLIVSLTFPVAKSLACVTVSWAACYGVMRSRRWGRT